MRQQGPVVRASPGRPGRPRPITRESTSRASTTAPGLAARHDEPRTPPCTESLATSAKNLQLRQRWPRGHIDSVPPQPAPALLSCTTTAPYRHARAATTASLADRSPLMIAPGVASRVGKLLGVTFNLARVAFEQEPIARYTGRCLQSMSDAARDATGCLEVRGSPRRLRSRR